MNVASRPTTLPRLSHGRSLPCPPAGPVWARWDGEAGQPAGHHEDPVRPPSALGESSERCPQEPPPPAQPAPLRDARTSPPDPRPAHRTPRPVTPSASDFPCVHQRAAQRPFRPAQHTHRRHKPQRHHLSACQRRPRRPRTSSLSVREIMVRACAPHDLLPTFSVSPPSSAFMGEGSSEPTPRATPRRCVRETITQSL